MARQTIELGREFTIVRPPAGEAEFVVNNFHDSKFDSLQATIRNSTSYPPPAAFVADEANGIIKLKGFSSVPQSTSLVILVQGTVAQKIEVTEQKIMFPEGAIADKAKEAVAGSWRTVKTAFWGFMIASMVFWFIKGSTFGDWIISVWSKINAAQVIQMADELDPRIMTNNHEVYETAAFTQVNSVYKEMFGSGGDLKELYRFVGNGFFVTADLIKNPDGSYMRVDREDAEEFCEAIAGRLLSTEELLSYLAGQYLTVENFIWPISLSPNEPEWSATKKAWDNYFVYMKDVPAKGLTPNKFTVRDEDDHKLAFRCGFDGAIFTPAK